MTAADADKRWFSKNRNLDVFFKQADKGNKAKNRDNFIAADFLVSELAMMIEPNDVDEQRKLENTLRAVERQALMADPRKPSENEVSQYALALIYEVMILGRMRNAEKKGFTDNTSSFSNRAALGFRKNLLEKRAPNHDMSTLHSILKKKILNDYFEKRLELEMSAELSPSTIDEQLKNLDIQFNIAKLDLVARRSALIGVDPAFNSQRLLENIAVIETHIKNLDRHEKIELLGLSLKVKNAKGRLGQIKSIAKNIIEKGTEPLLRHHHAPGQNSANAGGPTRGHIISSRTKDGRIKSQWMTPQKNHTNRGRLNNPSDTGNAASVKAHYQRPK